jgi:hypothetical protein
MLSNECLVNPRVAELARMDLTLCSNLRELIIFIALLGGVRSEHCYKWWLYLSILLFARV